MHENGLAVGRPFFAKAGSGLAAVEVAVDEIGDDVNGPLDVEFLESLAEEVSGDSGDAIALFDGEFRDREIGAVATNQGDVGAVERGDERKSPRRRHRAREKGADGVRNRVVDVEKIERFGLENFQHFCGESERVGRVIEKRVGNDFDFVEMRARIVGVHADGRSVADEMNIVAAGSELLAKLGSNDTGAAVGGVASDADLHETDLRRPELFLERS